MTVIFVITKKNIAIISVTFRETVNVNSKINIPTKYISDWDSEERSFQL